jgi:hypothetical protein
MHGINRRILGIIVGVTLLVVFGPVAVASAATISNKPYLLTIATTSNPYDTASGEVASGESMTMTATLTNESATQQIGSANLFWPTGFIVSVQPKSAGSVSQNCTDNGVAVGACVQLRNLALAPNGGSVTVAMSVTTPLCQQGSFAWSAEVKQANNFSGPPGNDFSYQPSGSLASTNLDGACTLKFSPAPTDAQTDQPISGSPYTPESAGGPAVTVQVVDSHGNLVPKSTIPVTMSLGTNPFNATLSGNPNPSTVDGTTTFPDLTLNKSGLGYTLVATPGPTQPPGATTLPPVSSTPFDIQDQSASCGASVTCTTTVNGSTLVASAGGAGELAESAFLGTYGQQTLGLCGSSYTSADPNVYESAYTPTPGTIDRSEVDTTTFFAPTTKPGETAQQVLNAQQICFGDAISFPTVSGGPAAAICITSSSVTQGVCANQPNGQTLFVGLLPTCTVNMATPCHNRQQDMAIPDKHNKFGYDVVLVNDVPVGWADDPYRM